MARHSGSNGKVKFGAAFVIGVSKWDFTEKSTTVELSAMGDGWDNPDPDTKSWSGTVELLLDEDPASGQSLRAGDVVDVEFYSDGDAVGKTLYTGSAVVGEMSVSTPYKSPVTRKYALNGKGPMSSAVVS